MDRRAFLTTSAGLALISKSATAAPESFTFVHFTDTHIEPELRAGEGTRKCFDAINKVPHDFSLAGGDLVFDVFEVGPARAKLLYDLYGKTVKDLHRKVHSVPGNHDIFGISPKSGVPSSDPMYGKKLYEDRIGPRYSSFDHKGWHFVLLDSIIVTPAHGWYCGVDAAQLEWLKDDLSRVSSQTPIVVLTHAPLVTGLGQILGLKPDELKGMMVANSGDVLKLFEGKNLKAVLQGHTHVCERVEYKGCQYITTGAVCGNWWKGLRFGFAEGFAVLTTHGNEISYEYRTFGWKADTTPAG